MEIDERLCAANGIRREDFEPRTRAETDSRLAEIEDAIIEIAGMIAEVADG